MAPSPLVFSRCSLVCNCSRGSVLLSVLPSVSPLGYLRGAMTGLLLPESQHWVSSWFFGILFGIVLRILRDTVAWGQWVLTQTRALTGCPDNLLVSALAISIQSCLGLVFCGLWLCFSLLDLVLTFTLAASQLWRSRFRLRALVPLL